MGVAFGEFGLCLGLVTFAGPESVIGVEGDCIEWGVAPPNQQLSVCSSPQALG
jgi:hypothetical protein